MSSAPGRPFSEAVARRKRLLTVASIVLVAVAWLAQGGVLANEWAYDDVAGVRDNPAVVEGGLSGAGRSFARDAWTGRLERGAWRPVTLASLALEGGMWDALGIDRTFGFRLTQVFLHGIAALLLLVLLVAWLPARPVLASGAAVLFAVHPLHTGTLSLVLGRADVLALVFSLGALATWNASGRSGGALRPLALALWLLALLSREAALGLPLIALGIDWVRGRRAAPNLLWLAPLALWLVLWPGPAAPPPYVEPASAAQRTALALLGMTRTALSLVLPGGLMPDRSNEAVASGGYDVVGFGADGVAAVLALVLTFVAAARLVAGRAGVVAAAWLAFAAIAFPAAFVLPPGATIQDRFGYMAGVALMPIGGLLLSGVLRPRLAPTFRWATAVAIVGALATLSRVEAAIWHDDVTLSEAMLERDPKHVRALVRGARRIREDVEAENAAAALRPTTPAALHARQANARERMTQAAGLLRRAINLSGGRRDAEAWTEWGRVNALLSQTDKGREAFLRALELEPGLAEGRSPDAVDPFVRARIGATLSALGRLDELQGDYEAAAFRYRTAATWMPGNPAPLEAAARMFALMGGFAEALGLLDRAIAASERGPARQRLEETVQTWRTAGRETAERLIQRGFEAKQEGSYPAARDAFESALRADPSFLQARLEAARLRGSYFGAYALAYKHLRQAEEQIEGRTGAEADAWRRRIRELREDLRAEERDHDRRERAEAEAEAEAETGGDDGGREERR